MWRRATLDFAEARRLPPRDLSPKYILYSEERLPPRGQHLKYILYSEERLPPGAVSENTII